MPKTRRLLLAVRDSHLALCQKIDAIDTIVLIRLQYQMRVPDWTADYYENLDAEQRRGIRKKCSLQKLASAEYVIASRTKYFLRYVQISDLTAVCVVAHACRTLLDRD